jgi:uncharacterized protein YbjT (DUF2867 family)
MNVLLTGATGFIGARLHRALLDAGHAVIAVARRPGTPALPHTRWLGIDFAQPCSLSEWQVHLAGVDVVVNTVGVFREHGAQTFEALHVRGPIALFEACAASGVARVVQLSALGADAHAQSAFHRSKKFADDRLLSLPLCGVVAMPSLVYGDDGPSARAFTMLASLPLLPLPGGGTQRVQPIHVDDVVQALCVLATSSAREHCGRIALVGPHALMLAEYLQALRSALQLPPASTVAVPRALVRIAARVGDRWQASLLDSASWQMLERGNVADPAAVQALLQRAPRAAGSFIAPSHAEAMRHSAQLRWLVPLLRASLAFVWIWTGIVSFGLYPVQDSYALLARVGVPNAWAPALLYGAAALDVLLGVATLWWPQRRTRRVLWIAQGALILGYTLIISVALPEFWLHPYGPLSKNVPLLVLLVLLVVYDTPTKAQRWNT